MIRTLARPPTGRCSLPMYMGFLLSEPKSATCTRLSEVMGLSHDSVNRFLWREEYEPSDLFAEAARMLNPLGGTLSVDDTVLDKPYSRHLALVGHFWSGKHHRVVKGLSLITLYYTDVQGRGLPVNYRVYDKAEGKTKNDYFREMLAEVRARGLQPAFVTGDSWYSGVDNLKAVRHHRMGFLFAVESNRRVSTQKGTWRQVRHVELPDEGGTVWLREFGEVKLFRTWLKDQPRHYVLYLPEVHQYPGFTRVDFQRLHDRHWHIEQYHRMIKQLCNIETFQVRGKVAIRNHIFAALCSYVHLQQLPFTEIIDNVYRWHRALYQEVIAAFVASFMHGKDYLNPQFHPAVNA